MSSKDPTPKGDRPPDAKRGSGPPLRGGRRDKNMNYKMSGFSICLGHFSKSDLQRLGMADVSSAKNKERCRVSRNAFGISRNRDLQDVHRWEKK